MPLEWKHLVPGLCTMDLDTFLAHAVKLEHEAVETYERFAARATNVPEDTAVFLKEMAHYARLHLGEILDHAGCRHADELPPRAYLWGDQAGPEALTALLSSGDAIDLDRAMTLAHEAERRAAHFYEGAAEASADPRVNALAREFAAEEHRHVLALERFMGLKPY